ncbi:hypothetical protein TrVE_jg13359 [Triparma verrucosa]|uniref:Golgi to ER traffic protein 4 n=2 Tax=Triparma TaxID=722752 RepID=A0A9W7EJG6_9STRA|nr:hypothetical protein TrST_g6974 [Triparma strigata]GMI04815.1 hypothetical protein TrVE_jg13359 [Triparma verrucosa]
MSAALARRKKQKAKAAAAAANSAPGTNTMEQRVKHLLSQTDTPSHYEALQLLTSNTHRSLKLGDVDKALKTAYDGTSLLLNYNQVEVASQMSLCYVTTLVDARVLSTDKEVTNILNISELYAKCAESRDSKKGVYWIEFLKAAMKWSAGMSETLLGDKRLHSNLGRVLWDQEEKRDAVVSLVLGEEVEEIISRIWDAGSERDYLFCVGVVNFLALQNMRDASALVLGFKAKFEGDSGAVAATRYCTFATWLLEICKRDAGQLYQWLASQFQDISRDPQWGPLLTKIGKVYFGIKPPPNMLSMLEGMLGGGM